jgi:hypothetical protein
MVISSGWCLFATNHMYYRKHVSVSGVESREYGHRVPSC